MKWSSRSLLLSCIGLALAFGGVRPALAVQAGITLDVHQDIHDPNLWPNDFHIQGLICSHVGPPVIINRIDGLFDPNRFSCTMVKVNPSDPNDCDYWFEATWWTPPGFYIPYCTVIHVGLLFNVDGANVIINLTGWWTRNGQPVGNMVGGLHNRGYVPIMGFDVQDVTPPQFVRIANGIQPGLPEPPLPPNPPPWPPADPNFVYIVQMEVVPFPPGMPPDFQQMFETGQQKYWPWVKATYADGQPISPTRPYHFQVDSFFDIFTELTIPPPGSNNFGVQTPFTIEPGGFLAVRQLMQFTNNYGEPEERWQWDVHGAQQTEACCFNDGHCEDLVPFTCLQRGGRAMGLGSNCNNTPCLPQGACCYGTTTILCVVTDQLTCQQQYGGQWKGVGTTCADTNGNGVADICEVMLPPEACCLPDGTCQMLPPDVCQTPPMNGRPMGAGSRCIGDLNANGIDDICETKWLQLPDLEPTGIDVKATSPNILADDFECREHNLITDIIVWGSWLNDLVPGDPGNVQFTLSLHADIPKDPNVPGSYSRPGPVLWLYTFLPQVFQVTQYQGGIQEGWWDPTVTNSYIFPGDTICYMYHFRIPPGQAFCQLGTPEQPVVYWLDVQAQPMGGPVPAAFGWKTSRDHWNDDGVFGQGPEPYPGPWGELRYPPLHQYQGESVDLAFAIGSDQPCLPTGACCAVPALTCTVTVEAACQPPNFFWKGAGTLCTTANICGCKASSNCDLVVSWRDIDYFVAAQNDAVSAWFKKFLPNTPSCSYWVNDVNNDGHVSWRDITPFVSKMNMTCPHP